MPTRDTSSGGKDRLGSLLILREQLMHDPHDAAAWLQLASLIGDPEREKYCLVQVLKIDPQHAVARARLNALLNHDPEVKPSPEPVQTWQEARCPYVGLHDDAQSLAAFASTMNYCYRLKEPKAIKLEYQQQFCLSPAHQRCLVFQRGEKAVAQNSREKPAVQPAQGKPAVDHSSS